MSLEGWTREIRSDRRRPRRWMWDGMQDDKHSWTARARLPQISARARSQRQQKYGRDGKEIGRGVELMEAPHAIQPYWTRCVAACLRLRSCCQRSKSHLSTLAAVTIGMLVTLQACYQKNAQCHHEHSTASLVGFDTLPITHDLAFNLSSSPQEATPSRRLIVYYSFTSTNCGE